MTLPCSWRSVWLAISLMLSNHCATAMAVLVCSLLREFVVELAVELWIELPAKIVGLHLGGEIFPGGSGLDRVRGAANDGRKFRAVSLNIRLGFRFTPAGNRYFKIQLQHTIENLRPLH